MNSNPSGCPLLGFVQLLFNTGDYLWTISYSGDTALGIPAAYSCNIEDVQGYTYAYNNLSGAGGRPPSFCHARYGGNRLCRCLL